MLRLTVTDGTNLIGFTAKLLRGMISRNVSVSKKICRLSMHMPHSRHQIIYHSKTRIRSLSTSESMHSKDTPLGTSDKSYAATLLLPKTDFPLQVDAIKRDEQYRQRTTVELYDWQAENNPKDSFILHDGPPYANGHLHIGHALNKILKDIILRYKILQGHKVSYIPGWDCHGLPIELKALERQRGQGSALSPLEIRDLARKTALEAVNIQKAEFLSWGLIGDWENAYLTLDKDYEVRQLKVFHEMMKRGYIYRQNKPVYWSPSSRTALAEAELEYPDDHKSISIYATMVIDKLPLPLQNILPTDQSRVSIIVWTTTPWTLPSNQAIGINPDMKYSFVEVEGDKKEYFLIASERLSEVQKDVNIVVNEVLAEILGSYLIHTTYRHPIYDTIHKVIAASYVNECSGTGLVHLAPGHGMEDYEACKAQSIAIFSPVDDFGRFTKDVKIPDFVGKNVLTDGTEAVIDYLRSNGRLLKQQQYEHKYPYDWRTKKPVILRATPQWFANVEEIKKRAIEALQNVRMLPETARHRLESFILSRNEWCISRQRAWGVPIPVLYDKETGDPLLTNESVQHITEIIREHGSDAWWTMDENELIAPEYRNNGCGYRKGMDIMDVWFDSGISWTLIDEKLKRESHRSVADLYLEGSDQHRGWFQSSLLTSVAVLSKSPYSMLVTHGFVLDEKSRKMSKSVGNVVSPVTVTHGGKGKKANGADVLRLWVASSEYTSDVTIGSKILEQIADYLKKYRNTARFLLGNINTFDYKMLLDYSQLKSVDKYMLHELYHFGKTVTNAYNDFAFIKVMQALNIFTYSSLSAFYFDIVKDTLYADSAQSLRRRSVQTAFYHILTTYMLSLAPIAPHLAEEIYSHFKHVGAVKHSSVFKLGWMDLNPQWDNPQLQSEWEVLKKFRSEVNNVLEKARKNKIIKSSLEAAVDIYVSDASSLYTLLQKYEKDLDLILITSNASIITDRAVDEKHHFMLDIENLGGGSNSNIVVKKAAKHKCPRCWIYNADEGKLCKRCEAIISI